MSPWLADGSRLTGQAPGTLSFWYGNGITPGPVREPMEVPFFREPPFPSSAFHELSVS